MANRKSKNLRVSKKRKSRKLRNLKRKKIKKQSSKRKGGTASRNSNTELITSNNSSLENLTSYNSSLEDKNRDLVNQIEAKKEKIKQLIENKEQEFINKATETSKIIIGDNEKVNGIFRNATSIGEKKEGGKSGARIFFITNNVNGEQEKRILKVFNKRDDIFNSDGSMIDKLRNYKEKFNNDSKATFLRDLRDIMITNRLSKNADIMRKPRFSPKMYKFGIIKGEIKEEKDEEENRTFEVPTEETTEENTPIYLFMYIEHLQGNELKDILDNFNESERNSLKKLNNKKLSNDDKNKERINIRVKFQKKRANRGLDNMNIFQRLRLLKNLLEAIKKLHESFKEENTTSELKKEELEKEELEIGCHRDLHPGNVFVNGDAQEIKLFDFDLSVIDSHAKENDTEEKLYNSLKCNRTQMGSNPVLGNRIATTVFSTGGLTIKHGSNPFHNNSIINQDADLYNYFSVLYYMLNETKGQNNWKGVFDQLRTILINYLENSKEPVTEDDTKKKIIEKTLLWFDAVYTFLNKTQENLFNSLENAIKMKFSTEEGKSNAQELLENKFKAINAAISGVQSILLDKVETES